MDEENQKNNKGKATGILKTVASKKIGLSSLKKKIILACIPTILLIIGIVCVLIIVLASLESSNTTEINNNRRIQESKINDSEKTDYEKKLEEFQLTNNIIGDVNTDDTSLDYQNKYYDALYAAYQHYKQPYDQTGTSFIQQVADWWGNIFNAIVEIFDKIKSIFDNITARDTEMKAPYLSKYQGYGISTDISLISSTLFINRYYADMLMTDEFDHFYFNSDDNPNYYDLHTGSYRDNVEGTFFKVAKDLEEVEEEQKDQNPIRETDYMDPKKIIIDGIQVLSKYMVLREERYLTITQNADWHGDFTDTTRHIKITNEYVELGECRQILKIIQEPEFQFNRLIGGEYKWKTLRDLLDEGYSRKEAEELLENLSYCPAMFHIDTYDDAEYYSENEYGGKHYVHFSMDEETGEATFEDGDIVQSISDYSLRTIKIGTDYSFADPDIPPIKFSMECYEGGDVHNDYKEYLLGNLPTKEDVEMFCSESELGTNPETGEANSCYGIRFTESYYHQFVNDPEKTSIDARNRDVQRIVEDMYSMFEFYQGATGVHSYCNPSETDIKAKDQSCGSNWMSYILNNYYGDINIEDYIGDIDVDGETYDPEAHTNVDSCIIDLAQQYANNTKNISINGKSLSDLTKDEWARIRGSSTSDENQRNILEKYGQGLYTDDCAGLIRRIIDECNNVGSSYDSDYESGSSNSMYRKALANGDVVWTANEGIDAFFAKCKPGYLVYSENGNSHHIALHTGAGNTINSTIGQKYAMEDPLRISNGGFTSRGFKVVGCFDPNS